MSAFDSREKALHRVLRIEVAIALCLRPLLPILRRYCAMTAQACRSCCLVAGKLTVASSVLWRFWPRTISCVDDLHRRPVGSRRSGLSAILHGYKVAKMARETAARWSLQTGVG